MKKVVINSKYGGFGLSKEACEFLQIPYEKYGSIEAERYREYRKRTDPALVACVETLGAKANGPNASLQIIEIDDTDCFRIEEYDGRETLQVFDAYY